MGERRYYEIAGITVQVESDLPFADDTFDAKFASFRREGPGPDTVVIRHHFGLPYEETYASGGGREWRGVAGGEWQEVYRRPPWAIYRTADGSWVYEGIAPDEADPGLHRVAVFSADHGRGELYNPEHAADWWRDGGLGALTMFPSDQIWLGRLLPDRDACYLHSGAVVMHPPGGGPGRSQGAGLLFVGHSDAGKSTTMGLLKDALGERVAILCDDRNIVRRWGADGQRRPEGGGRGAGGTGDAAGRGRRGVWVHGTWSHGDVAEVSSAGAPLRAILFLEHSPDNALVPLDDRKQVWQRLLATLIRPVVSGAWWHKAMDVLEGVVAEVPCCRMRFDRSGAIVPRLEELAR